MAKKNYAADAEEIESTEEIVETPIDNKKQVRAIEAIEELVSVKGLETCESSIGGTKCYITKGVVSKVPRHVAAILVGSQKIIQMY